MKTNLSKTAQWLNALLLVVAVAVAGGCEEPTNPVTAPGEVGHKLARTGRCRQQRQGGPDGVVRRHGWRELDEKHQLGVE